MLPVRNNYAIVGAVSKTSKISPKVQRYKEVDGVWMRVGDNYVYRKNGLVRIRRETELVEFLSRNGSLPVPKSIRVSQWNEGNTFRIEIDLNENEVELTRSEDFVIQLPLVAKFRSGDLSYSCETIDLTDPGLRAFLTKMKGD